MPQPILESNVYYEPSSLLLHIPPSSVSRTSSVTSMARPSSPANCLSLLQNLLTSHSTSVFKPLLKMRAHGHRRHLHLLQHASIYPFPLFPLQSTRITHF